MNSIEKPLIQVRNLKKGFGDQLILNDVSMDIKKGERVI